MADVASLLAEFQKGIEGKDTGLGATVKFDFEGSGCIFLDGKSNPNTVSDEDKDFKYFIFCLERPHDFRLIKCIFEI